MSTPERIPLKRVMVRINSWMAPGYQLPDGRVIFAPEPGTIQADTLELIRTRYPAAEIVDMPEDRPDAP